MFELRRERQSYFKVRLNERKEIEQTEVWIDADALVRNDGFRLVRLGRIRQGIKNICFRYFKGHLQFEFFGDRAHWDGTITDTWDITLSFGSLLPLRIHSWPPDRRTVEEMAADIESALRAWPPYPEERGIPVGVVHVRITYQCEMRLRFGQHSALRHEPPSAHWRREMVPYRDQQHASMVRDDVGCG